MKNKYSLLSEVIRRRMYELNIRNIKSLEDLAGVPRDTIRNLMAGRTKTIRADKLEPISKALKMDVSELVGSDTPTLGVNKDEYIMVPRYDVRLAAGDGAFPNDENVLDYIPFNAKWLKRSINGGSSNLAVVEVNGDSMEPAIRSGDEVMINLSDTSLVDGGIFAILMNDTLVIKRIFPSLDGLEIRSDNPLHPSWQVKNEDLNNLKVIGRAVVRVGKLN